MTRPLIAWAAVAPDGTPVVDRTWQSKEEAIAQLRGQAHRWDESYMYRAGWRVVQVEIRVKEDGNDH